MLSLFLQIHSFPDTVQIYVSFSDPFCYSATHFPINRLRNYAIQHVRTSHFVVLDMDLHFSRDIYAALRVASPVSGGVQGGHAPLRERAAHQTHDARTGQLCPDQVKLPPVSPVEGVVFADDAHDGFHVRAHAPQMLFWRAFLGFPPSI